MNTYKTTFESDFANKELTLISEGYQFLEGEEPEPGFYVKTACVDSLNSEIVYVVLWKELAEVQQDVR